LGAKEFEEIVRSGNLKQLSQAVFRNKTIRESLINFNIPTRLSNEDLYSQQNNKKKVDPNSKSLIGQGGSPGTVTGIKYKVYSILILRISFLGKARVITDLNDADLVQPGEILVTHHTSPGWTPLFSLIAGLVTEEGTSQYFHIWQSVQNASESKINILFLGGILSHGAVVAREFKIPAVLRVKEATTVVKTGQTITINGGSGVVELS
jgi:phosphoenolpyruvate synthase/pyruvate phosphate dikinase